MGDLPARGAGAGRALWIDPITLLPMGGFVGLCLLAWAPQLGTHALRNLMFPLDRAGKMPALQTRG